MQIKKGETEKYVGKVKLNLDEYVEEYNGASRNNQRQVLSLEKCPDKNAKIAFTIRSVLVSGNDRDTETISLASGT